MNIERYLRGLNLPIPEILHESPDKSFLILQDLGDETLERQIQKVPSSLRHWYAAACDLMIELQGRAKPSKDCIAFERSFDETLFNWEFDHFLEYGIEARLGRQVTPDDRALFVQETRALSHALCALPRVFTHRDFQSRNLLIHEDRLWLIDFQDALIGPLGYDLVALLRDSYIVLDPATLSDLVGDYVTKASHLKVCPLDVDSFRETFDRITIQRKLKDAGRFVFIDRVKKNPSFLPFVAPSLSYVREAFERQPDLKTLFELLKKYVPEFN